MGFGDAAFLVRHGIDRQPLKVEDDLDTYPNPYFNEHA